MLAAQLEQLLRHMEWADALVWTVCLGSPAVRESDEMHARLHHIHIVQRAFLQIWREQEIDVPKAETFEQLEALFAWARPYYAEAFEFARGLDESQLAAPVVIPWAERNKERWGGAGPVNLAETLLQVITHTSHHRGQVMTRLRALDCDAPLVDYIIWVSAGRPAAQWTAIAPGD